MVQRYRWQVEKFMERSSEKSEISYSENSRRLVETDNKMYLAIRRGRAASERPTVSRNNRYRPQKQKDKAAATANRKGEIRETTRVSKRDSRSRDVARDSLVLARLIPAPRSRQIDFVVYPAA